MELTFITGNGNKFKEAETLLGIPLVQKKVDLPEIQSLDPHEVMAAKLRAAREHAIGPCIVEDSSLTFACFGHKLPGPFIKWFEESLGIEKLAKLAIDSGDARAKSSTVVGYLDGADTLHYFDGVLEGYMVMPRGDQDFGYGPAFLPDGSMKTFGEMTREEKHAVSSRALAFTKLKSHLAKESV